MHSILLIDDDIDILDQVTAILEGSGYKVTQAEGQREGEKLLADGGFDLVIVDLMMEQMDSGFIICHKIKKHTPELPVIMMTAVASSTGMAFNPHDDEDHSWVKADAFLDKPVLPEKLLQHVRQLLASKA